MRMAHRTKAAPRERNLRRSIVERLRQERDVYVCSVVGGAFGQGGVPDLLCCVAGRFVGLEVKRPLPESQTTPLQDVQAYRIRLAGGLAFVVRSVEEALAAIGFARGPIAAPEPPGETSSL